MTRFFAAVAIALVAAALYFSYHAEPFGWASTIGLGLLVALANKYLGLRDTKIGFAAALLLGLLAGATSMGSQKSFLFICLATSVAALVGYIFGTQKIDDTEVDEPPKRSPDFKSGKGGDFGGGGSSGDF